jgi:tetratricopeptide (TPR) repeat protein
MTGESRLESSTGDLRAKSEPTAQRGSDGGPLSNWRSLRYFLVAAGLALVAGLGFLVLKTSIAEIRWSRSARQAFAARDFVQARLITQAWLEARPTSGEAHYYRARLALVEDRPRDAVEAMQEAKKQGFDEESLRCLRAILQARTGQFGSAEPVLRQAYDREVEPRPEIACELARVYLKTFRLSEAARVIERWQTLDQSDPRPYMWSNEIASRSNAAPEVLIANYKAALERDPNLDKAILGLAEQLTKARRFAESEPIYRAYLARNPRDASATVAFGRNAFQAGDIEQARQLFESALTLDPRQTDALRELAASDLGLGLLAKACERYQRLTELEPFDYEIRYAYSRALRLLGDNARAKAETDRATKLRAEFQRVGELQHKLLANPGDSKARFEVAKWMLENGHEPEGLKWCNEILRAEPNHVQTHRLLVGYYQKRGEHGLANYHSTMASLGPEER